MASLCTCPHCGREIDLRRVKTRAAKKSQPLVKRAPTKPNTQGKYWQSMRVLRKFTAQEIASTADADVGSARNYVTALVQAGYVRVVHVSSGEVGDYTTYALAKDTGPQAPRLRKDGKSLLDLNLDKEVPRVRGAR